MTESEANRESPVKITVIIDERKLDYIFNRNIKPDPHNSSRAAQNAIQLQRIGIYDDSEGREIVKRHLEQTVTLADNVSDRFVNKYGVDIENREALLAGPSGKFIKVQSSWEIMADGTRRFLSFQPFGVQK